MSLKMKVSELETLLDNAERYIESIDAEPGSRSMADRSLALRNIRSAKQLL